MFVLRWPSFYQVRVRVPELTLSKSYILTAIYPCYLHAIGAVIQRCEVCTMREMILEHQI